MTIVADTQAQALDKTLEEVKSRLEASDEKNEVRVWFHTCGYVFSVSGGRRDSLHFPFVPAVQAPKAGSIVEVWHVNGHRHLRYSSGLISKGELHVCDNRKSSLNGMWDGTWKNWRVIKEAGEQ